MVEKIKPIIDKKFENLKKNIDTLQNKIGGNHNALHTALGN